MPEIWALHQICHNQLPNPFFPKPANAGNWKCRQKLGKECQLFSYQAQIKRLRLVTMCLAKIGPNAGLLFRGVALRATVDGQVAWLRCTSTSSWKVQLVQQEEEGVETSWTVWCRYLPPPPPILLQLARNWSSFNALQWSATILTSHQ